MKKIKILLATYNPGTALEEQISSILKQKDVAVTIDIFDDGSPDQSYLDTCCNDPRITLRKLPATGGAGKSFLRAVSLTDIDQHDFFAFSDQDDIWLEDKLSSAVAFMSEKNADGYSSNLSLFDGKRVFGTLRKSDRQVRYDHLFQGASAGCTYVMNAALFAQIQTIVKTLDIENLPKHVSHDWMIYFLARASGKRWHHDTRSFILYRQHTDNIYGAKKGLSGALSRLALINEGLFKDNSDVIRHLSKQQNFNIPVIRSSTWFKKLGYATQIMQFRREGKLSVVAYLLWLFGVFYSKK